MNRFWLPLFLLALGIFGLLEHEEIRDQWAAMYPDDAAHQDALTHCAEDDAQFNRFNPERRAACYEKYLQVELPATAPETIPVQAPDDPTPPHFVPHPPTVQTDR
jgi:hypothetical protein